MRRQELHKRLPISKTISKNFLDKFLDTGMLYGTGIFRGSNKKEPKTLVNTGVSASFIVFYHRAKSVIFWPVDVPWKPFALWARGFESHTLRQQKGTFVYQKFLFVYPSRCRRLGMWSMRLRIVCNCDFVVTTRSRMVSRASVYSYHRLDTIRLATNYIRS